MSQLEDTRAEWVPPTPPYLFKQISGHSIIQSRWHIKLTIMNGFSFNFMILATDLGPACMVSYRTSCPQQELWAGKSHVPTGSRGSRSGRLTNVHCNSGPRVPCIEEKKQIWNKRSEIANQVQWVIQAIWRLGRWRNPLPAVGSLQVSILLPLL